MRTCLHDLNEGDDLVHVFAGSHETLQHEDLEVLKHVGADASHHLQPCQGANYVLGLLLFHSKTL